MQTLTLDPRRVAAGETLRPWLILGPFYEDLGDQVEGLTLFERPGATVGKTVMEEVAAQALPVLAAAPREGDHADFRGHTACWSLVRRPEPFLSWGQYNISNHLGAAFLTTLVRPAKPGTYRWRLTTEISSQAIVSVNGELVLNTAEQPVMRQDGLYQYEFEADLDDGDHRLTVALFRLGRMARVGLHLTPIEDEVEARLPLPEGMTEERRRQIEVEVSGLRLTRDVFYPHHSIDVTLASAPQGAVLLQLLSDAGAVVAEAEASAAGATSLCSAEALPDGAYTLRASWSMTDVTFDLKRASPRIAPAGYGRYEARKQQVLLHYAANEERRPIWTQVARYALHQAGVADAPAVDENAIRETCEFIAARKDCADFVIQGVLRMMAWERTHRPLLSPEIHAMMKDTVLGFKYWVDEPGDTVMYMGSENHRLLFHVAEWMAGQLFPTEEFTNSRQRGLYHATKGRTYITEWLRQRGRFGFDEWHSNSYYPVNIAPLLNVHDFAIYEDSKLRQMAGAVLDMIFFNLAADTYRGVFGTTHGRSYGINLKYPDFEGTAATCWLLYGTAALTAGTSGMAPVSLATSDYALPEILHKMANDDQAVIESRQRQGLVRGSAQSANFCVYRTPDYMISGLQDHRKGEPESSSHVAQVTLGQKSGEQPAVVFWSCPFTSGEGSGLRPDYWSGHLALPRVIQVKNVLSLTWRLLEHTWLRKFFWLTHCFFEPARFDEVEIKEKWAFGRVGDGYIGVYSQHGMAFGDEGEYAGRELICTASDNTWLVECGRAADWGTFDAFVRALSAAEIGLTDDALTYVSPSIGRFTTGWDVVPEVEGEPVKLDGYPLVESAWAQADFGAGELTLCYDDETYELWFNQ